MKSLAYIPGSNQAANASLMTVQTLRSPGASDIIVNTVTGVSAKFYGSMGAPHTFIDPATGETITIISEATAVDFAGHLDSGKVVIDAIAPGYVDTRGSLVGDIVVVRPVTEWANNIFNVLSESHNDDGTLKASAYTYNPNPILDYMQSGGLLTTLTGFNAAITASVAWIGGYRGTVAALASRAYTASKDTYVDILRNTTTGVMTLVYTEVANNAAAPTLAANSIRIAKVVTSGAAITSIIQYGKDALTASANTIYPSNLVTQKLWINTRDLGAAAGSGVFNMASPPYAWLDPADYAVPGKTTYMRLVVAINKTASDQAAAVLANYASVPIIGVGTNNSQVGVNGLVSGQELFNNGSSTSVYIKSAEMPFPTVAISSFLRMWNFSSASNFIAVPVAYLEIYWR